MNPKRQLRTLVLIGLLLVIASFTFTYLTFLYSFQQRPSPKQIVPDLPRTGEEVTEKGAAVIRKIFYAKSKLEVEERSVLPDELVGLTKKELAARLNNGVIERFTPTEIVTREIRDELAPLHASRRFLGISGDYVAVFRGVPGLAYEVVDKTDIPVNTLPPQERNDLKKGILVHNDKNMMEVLMGLSSLAFAD